MNITVLPNPDLLVGPDCKPGWNSADRRRGSFHALHQRVRYAQSFRAGYVLPLFKKSDLSIAARSDVVRLTGLPWFSAMVVLRGQDVLFEKYAADFRPDQPHSIMSISKTTMNLVVGRLVTDGQIDLEARVDSYLPWIGAGYASATVQQVLNMDVNNDYTEDYSDPSSKCFLHEASTGWRLPEPGQTESSMRGFLASVGLADGASDCVNRSGSSMYRSANTDVLALIAESVSGRAVSSFIADIADASGIEGALHIATDRTGFALVDGGICLSARDLARYGQIFVRRGLGVRGEETGSSRFIDKTLAQGIPMPTPRDRLRYSNQTNTNGRWIGHGGYGGQYLLADLQSGVTCVFLSVLENEAAYDPAYFVEIISMLESIASGIPTTGAAAE